METWRTLDVMSPGDAWALVQVARRGRQRAGGASLGAAGGRVVVEHALSAAWRAMAWSWLTAALEGEGIWGPLTWWVGRYPIGGRHPAHPDVGADPVSSKREWSISVGLNDSDLYEGGDLVLWDTDPPPWREVDRFRLDPGQAILFPSTAWHEVEEVTSGERWALVGWVS